MQSDRTRWIVGLLLSAIAVAAGLVNISDAVAAGLGPERLAGLMGSQPAFVQESLAPQLVALESGLYRWGQVVQGVVGLVAAGVLLVGGLALIARAPVWRSLVKAWVYYALLAAPLTAALSASYLYPATMDHLGEPFSRLGLIMQGLFITILQCLLPCSILLLLRLPALGLSRDQRGLAPSTSADSAGSDHAFDAEQRAAGTSFPSEPTRTPPSTSTGTSLRDDPWNDPSAT